MRKRKYYEIWERYDDLIRSLHKKEKKNFNFWSYFKKILVVFFASLITTFSFQFLMEPNGLLNSGINGILQVISRYISQKQITNSYSFSSYYYTLVLLVNIIIISLTQFFIPGNFEINSTAFFYVIFQFIWSWIFQFFALKKYLFNRFSPKTWSRLSNEGQLALTLPFYILVALISSVLHTYGYSLIYKVKSSPGGLDIITSALSQNDDKKKKSRISIGGFSKIFGLVIIFLITFFNFIFIEGNNELVINQLINFVNEEKIFNRNIETKKELFCELENIKEKINSDFKDKEGLEKRVRSINLFLNLDLVEISVVINYLKNGRVSLIEYYENERKKMFDGRNTILRKNSLTGIHLSNNQDGEYDSKLEELKKKEEEDKIISRIERIKDNTYERSFPGYIRYVSNDEKFWASMFYIVFSSYVMSELFPKDKFIKIYFKICSESDFNELLNLLNDYKTYYFKAKSIDNNEEVSIVCCLITRWNYQLIYEELKKFEKIAILETDEKS